MSPAELWLFCHPPGLPEAGELAALCRQMGMQLRQAGLDRPPDQPPPRAVVMLSLEPLLVDQLGAGAWLQAGFEAGARFLTLGAAGTLLADLAGGVVLASTQPQLSFEPVSLTEEGSLDPLASLLREGGHALITTALEVREGVGLTPLAYGGSSLLMTTYLERSWGVMGFPWVDGERLEAYLKREEFLALLDLCRTLPTQLRAALEHFPSGPAAEFGELMEAFLGEVAEWLGAS